MSGAAQKKKRWWGNRNYRRTGIKQTKTLTAEQSIVRERICANPFEVPETDLAIYSPEVVIRSAPSRDGLQAVVSRKAKIRTIIESFLGVHYCAAEKAYYIPAHIITPLVKVLRDREVLFAVEQQLGHHLKQTAPLRARINANPDSATKEMLHGALLTPYLCRQMLDDSGFVFSVVGATAEQYKALLPGVTPQSRRKKASAINADELLSLLYLAKFSGVHLWASADVLVYLRGKRRTFQAFLQEGDPFSQELLGFLIPSSAWILGKVDGEARAGLFTTKRFLDALSSQERAKLEDTSENPIVCSSIPGTCESDLEESLFFPCTDYRFKSLRDAYPQISLESNECVEYVKEITRRDEVLAKSNFYNSLKDTKVDELDDELEKKLFPHQRVAVSWMLHTPHAFLGDDMGLGKTLSVLSTFSALHAQGLAQMILIVCPHSLTRNWIREVERWTPDLRIMLMPSRKRERADFLGKVATAPEGWVQGVVLNYEAIRLPDVFPALRTYCSSRETLLVLDESQRAKNPQSKTFLALAEIAPVCSRRVLLSGTPTPKAISDIWAQFALLDGGERFGTNYYEWLETIAELGNKWSPYAVKSYKKDAVEQTILRVRELLLRRKKEDVVNLPEKIFSVRDIELKGEQRKRYDEIRKELLLRVRTVNGKVYIREIESILEEFLRAVQIASNPRLIDPEWKGEPAKFLELDEIVQEVVVEREQKLVVWTNYLDNVSELCDRYARYGAAGFTGSVSADARAKLVEQFQERNSDLKILIAIPAAGGVGITLTAAQTAVYIDKTWNAEHWMQSIDRIHRIGQQGTVSVISLHACPVDEIIYRNLIRKKEIQSELLGDGEERGSEHSLYPDKEELEEILASIYTVLKK